MSRGGRSPLAHRPRALLPLLGLLCLCSLAAAPKAHAYLYWTSHADGLTRAGNDGSGLGFLIHTPPFSDAVAIDSTYVYWTTSDGRIGRAKLDGSEQNPNFITGLGGNLLGLAVDSAHIYWSSVTSIGRANLDGSGVEPSFRPVSRAVGLAVDGAHIYFGENGFGHVGRVRLDGSYYEPDWIEAPGDPCSVAVDSNHVYWADAAGNRIGRADLTGEVVEPAFIDPGARIDCGVAVDSSYVYFGIDGELVAPSRIARANLDGSGLNPDLFSLATYGGPDVQLAVNSLSAPLPTPPNSFSIVGLFRNKHKGFARVKVKLPGPGRVVVFAKRVRKAVRNVSEARTVAVRIRPKRGLAKRLRRKRRAAVRYRVRFTPTGGGPRTKRKQVLLVRRR